MGSVRKVLILQDFDPVLMLQLFEGTLFSVRFASVRGCPSTGSHKFVRLIRSISCHYLLRFQGGRAHKGCRQMGDLCGDNVEITGGQRPVDFRA